jgi:predicted metal-dependent TIM-barrel fold hydrolase
MTADYPTKRPTDIDWTDESDTLPSELTTLPWIDIHNHAHTLSWNDRERFDLSGCHAMVMMAAAYYWTPYKPVAPDDVRYLWDDALNRLDPIGQSHVFDPYLGIGVHTGARVENAEELLNVMPEYLALDEVAAVGEIGITASQHVSRWDLDSQTSVMRRQLELADEYDLPAVAHTPPNLDNVDIPYRERGPIPGYELNMDLQQEATVEGDDAKRAATELDIELKDEAGLSDNQLVLSHADQSVARFVLENTDCYVSFTISYPWLLGVTARDVAAIIKEYGPERVLVETDSAGILRSDVFSFRRTVLDLYRLGIDIDAIRQVIYENPKQILQLD